MATKRVTLIFSVLLLLWLAIYCVQTGRMIIASYNPLPETDYWEVVPHIDGYLHIPPMLWEQHYEHRVVFPEMVFAFDFLFLRGREILPMLLIVVLNVAVWGIFVLLARKSFPDRNLAFCAIVLAGIVMAWPGQAYVLAFPFSLQWLLYQFSAVACLWTLSMGRLRWTVVLAIIATFSSANGLFVWPVLLFLVWCSTGRTSTLARIALAGAISAGIFFIQYRNLGNMHPGVVLTHTSKFVGYFLSYLGMPFGAVGTITALAAGFCSLVVLVWLAFLTWSRRWIAEPLPLVCLGLCLLTIITALSTSLSRIPVDRPFVDAIVTPGRYVLFAAHYWAAITVLLISFLARVRPGNVGLKPAWIGVGVLTMFFAGTLLRTGDWVKNWMYQYAIYQYGALEIEAGLVNKEAALNLNYADARPVYQGVQQLKQKHLALFSGNDYAIVGQSLASLVERQKVELPPSLVTDVQKVEGGVRLVGWAEPHPKLVAIVDNTDRIIGLGRHLPAGAPIGIPMPDGHADDFWIGFASDSYDRKQARYFSIQ